MPKIHWEPGILLKAATKLSLPFSEYQHAKYEHEVLNDLSLAPLWLLQHLLLSGLPRKPAAFVLGAPQLFVNTGSFS